MKISGKNYNFSYDVAKFGFLIMLWCVFRSDW